MITREIKPTEAERQAVAKMPPFTAKLLAVTARIPEARAQGVCLALVREKSLVPTGRQTVLGPVYQSANSVQAEEAAPTGDMTVLAALWTTMRTLKRFTLPELHFATQDLGVTVEMGESYIKDLVSSGYLRAVGRPLKDRNQQPYLLVNDTGPFPPERRRVRALFDPNENRFTHIAGQGALK